MMPAGGVTEETMVPRREWAILPLLDLSTIFALLGPRC